MEGLQSKMIDVYYEMELLKGLRDTIKEHVKFMGQVCEESCGFNEITECSLFKEHILRDEFDNELRCNYCVLYFKGI